MKKIKTSSRKYDTSLLWIITAAFFIRCYVLYDYYHSILWNGIWMDSAMYNNWAKAIVASGDWIGKEAFFMTPFYPYFLAIVYTIFGDSLFAVRFIQIIISTGTVLLIYAMTEKLFSRKAAIAAGIFAAFYGPFVFFVNLLLVETLKVFFVTLALYWLIRVQKELHEKYFVYAGLSLGAAILCRPTDALLAIVALLCIFFFMKITLRTKIRSAILFLLPIILFILPVTVRNCTLSHELIFITSNGGLNFFLGNNAEAKGVFYNPEGFSLADDPTGRGYLEQFYHQKLTQGEASKFWMEKGWNYIASQPLDFLELTAKKFLLFFNHKEIGQLGYGYEFMASHISPILSYLVVFIIVFPFAFLALIRLGKQWKTYFLLYGFLFTEIYSIVIFFITDRYRLSAMPMFIMFAGAGVVSVLEALKLKNHKTLITTLLLLLLGVSLTTGLNFEIMNDYSAEYYNMGLTYFDAKKYSEAMQAFNASLQYRDGFAVRNGIGNVYTALGDFPKAYQEYWIGHEQNPKQAISMFSIGSLYARKQIWDSALFYFDRALTINPRFAPAHLNKGLTLYYLQRFEEALPELEYYARDEENPEKTKSVLRDIESLKRIIAERKK